MQKSTTRIVWRGRGQGSEARACVVLVVSIRTTVRFGLWNLGSLLAGTSCVQSCRSCADQAGRRCTGWYWFTQENIAALSCAQGERNGGWLDGRQGVCGCFFLCVHDDVFE